jgi:hypothetical protein
MVLSKITSAHALIAVLLILLVAESANNSPYVVIRHNFHKIIPKSFFKPTFRIFTIVNVGIQL